MLEKRPQYDLASGLPRDYVMAMEQEFDSARAIIEISGNDHIPFLQGLLTQDMNLLGESPLLFAALLSPQGKFAHDFFLFAHQDIVLLDTPAAQMELLLKRLAMYKLRAAVAFRDASEQWRVSYVSKGGLTDPRHPDMPQRIYQSSAARNSVRIADYHQKRLALGIPESPFDTTEGDVAMDLGYDLLNAISFTKGCYVGQEVTARMHYKNIARRGFYIVESETDLPAPGTKVQAGELTVGTVRGAIGSRGLALLKFGEVEHASLNKLPLTVENRPLTATLPPWLAPKLARFRATHENQ